MTATATPLPLMPSTDDELLTKVSDEQSLETSDSGTKSESVSTATDNKAVAALPPIPKVIVPSSFTAHDPWYVRGGMHVNEVGLAFNIAVPAVFLVMTASEESKWLTQLSMPQLFVLVLIAQIVAAVVEGKRTTFCTVVFPVYLTTLLVIPSTLSTNPLFTIALATFFALWRIGICMSVCLHRYAAHAAFKCGPTTQLILNILGCAANQGGPIWWASQHRLHHKCCDVERDPHSAILDGVEKAFAFFQTHRTVVEEFAPRHNDTKVLRLLDTWSFLVCSVNLYLSYCMFGREGLFVTYTSMWLSQTGTLWFNIGNHPPNAHPNKDCQSTNYIGGGNGIDTGYYPGFWLLNFIYPYIAGAVAESNHDDHHNHSQLAKREPGDVMYYTFLLPLEKLGLIWNVKKYDEKFE
ncbi:hypothetical protein ACHAWC_007660 [Mediolabrus comicus]